MSIEKEEYLREEQKLKKTRKHIDEEIKRSIERLEQGKEENTDVLKSMSDEIWSLKAQVSTSQERVISRNIQILKLKSICCTNTKSTFFNFVNNLIITS